MTWRLGVATSLLLSLSAQTPASAEDLPLRLSYEVRLGGLPAAAIELDARIEAGRYRLRAKTESSGVVALLTGFRSEAVSHGELDENGGARPVEHRADNRWRGDSRWVRIRYPAGEAPVFEAFPPPEADDRDPVPRELTARTLDPLSAALQAALLAQRGEACAGRLEIFDGRRRYALNFLDRRPDNGGVRCRLALERIAGHSRDPWLPILRPVETAELWLAGAPPIPVRLQAETGLGTAVVRLTAINGAPP